MSKKTMNANAGWELSGKTKNKQRLTMKFKNEARQDTCWKMPTKVLNSKNANLCAKTIDKKVIESKNWRAFKWECEQGESFLRTKQHMIRPVTDFTGICNWHEIPNSVKCFFIIPSKHMTQPPKEKIKNSNLSNIESSRNKLTKGDNRREMKEWKHNEKVGKTRVNTLHEWERVKGKKIQSFKFGEIKSNKFVT